MKFAVATGEIIHTGRYCCVVYHAGRMQPWAPWAFYNARWHVLRYFEDERPALAEARRYEGHAA